MSQPENVRENEAPSYGIPQGYAQPGMEVQPQQEPARLGPLQRLTGTLFSPGETFADVNRKPTWLAPVIIAIVTALASSFFFQWRVHPDWDRIMRANIKRRDNVTKRTTPPEQIEQQVKVTKAISKFFPVFIVIGTP